jgi:hypothetical protein
MVLDGKIYQNGIRRLQPAGDDIETGQKPDFWSKPGSG